MTWKNDNGKYYRKGGEDKNLPIDKIFTYMYRNFHKWIEDDNHWNRFRNSLRICSYLYDNNVDFDVISYDYSEPPVIVIEEFTVTDEIRKKLKNVSKIGIID